MLARRFLFVSLGILALVFQASQARADYQVISYTPTGFTTFPSNLLGDPDGDGRLEYAGVMGGATVTIRDAMTGVAEFSTTFPEGIVTATAFHDLDGDGRPELLVATAQPGIGVIDFVGIATAVSDDAAPTSAKALSAPRPNPFNPSSVISFALDIDGRVDLLVYDASGRLLRTLIGEHRTAGRHEVTWDGRDDSGREVASGTYFYTLRVNDQAIASEKAVILR